MVDFKALSERRQGELFDEYEFRGLTDAEKAVSVRYLDAEEEDLVTPIAESDLSDDQALALYDVVTRLRDGEKVVTLGGYAGTGKSTLVPLIAAQWGSAAATAFCAPTGKAANVLARKLKAVGASYAYVGTIHGLMYSPRQDEYGRIVGWQRLSTLRTPGGVDVQRIIVDEASMVGSKLLEDLRSYDIPILLVGDHGQLHPVNDEFVLAEPDVRLETVHRQAADNPILQLATAVRQTGNIPKDFPYSDRVRFYSRDGLYEVIREAGRRAGDSTGVLVRRNDERSRTNRACTNGRHSPIVGDLVICLRNSAPIFNGMRGRVLSVEPYRLHWLKLAVEFKDDRIVVEGLANTYQFDNTRTIGSAEELRAVGIEYPQETGLTLLFDFGYVITVHKGQGSEFREVVLRPEKLLRDSEEDYARWLYTGITRASERLSIVW